MHYLEIALRIAECVASIYITFLLYRSWLPNKWARVFMFITIYFIIIKLKILTFDPNSWQYTLIWAIYNISRSVFYIYLIIELLKWKSLQ